LQSLGCVARCGVCFPREAIGCSSGAYEGQGAAVRRSLGAAPTAWGEALVGHRAPSGIPHRCAGVCARIIRPHAGDCAEWQRPARP
jgi:hypothetical protein